MLPDGIPKVQSGPFSKEERKQALMAALLLPLKDTVALKGKKTQPLTSYLILQSIKWRNVDAECIQQIHTEGTNLLAAYEQLQVLSATSKVQALILANLDTLSSCAIKSTN